MTLRCHVLGLLVATTACGSDREPCGLPEWKIAVIDDAAPLTSETGEPVARLDVRATDRCQRSLALDAFSVEFLTPPADDLGKSTSAMFPDNLLLMELEDENDDARLGAHDALLLREGPLAEVPPGIAWEVVLVIPDDDGRGGSGIAIADVLIE